MKKILIIDDDVAVTNYLKVFLTQTGLFDIVVVNDSRDVPGLLVREAFDVIVGGEDVSRHKPDPEGLLAAIGRLGGSPSNTLYVGDSVTDAEAARRAGVPFVAVLNGVTPREAFEDYPVEGVLENLRELVEHLEAGLKTSGRS